MALNPSNKYYQIPFRNDGVEAGLHALINDFNAAGYKVVSFVLDRTDNVWHVIFGN